MSGSRKISMQSVANAVRAAGPFSEDVARILYGDMGIAIPEDSTAKSAGPHSSYHRVDRQQAIEIAKADKEVVSAVEGADVVKTVPDTEPVSEDVTEPMNTNQEN